MFVPKRLAHESRGADTPKLRHLKVHSHRVGILLFFRNEAAIRFFVRLTTSQLSGNVKPSAELVPLLLLGTLDHPTFGAGGEFDVSPCVFDVSGSPRNGEAEPTHPSDEGVL